jgi:hypothetical protein
LNVYHTIGKSFHAYHPHIPPSTAWCPMEPNFEKRKDEIDSLPVGWSQVVRYIEKHFGSE